MKEKDDLFELIQSMDAHEKGYFKKYTRLHGNAGDNNYLLLFDAINRQQEYNEAQILQKFRGEKFIRQIGVAKHYLYELILRSLRAYRENQSTLARLNGWMENAEILFSKGMPAQAMKMVAKCRELIGSLDDPLRELEIQQWERKFIGEMKAAGMDDRMAASLAESSASVDRLKKQLELRNVYFSLLWIVRKDMSLRNKAVKQEMERIIEHPLLKDEDALEGFFQKLNFYNTWNIYYYLGGEKEKAYMYIRRVVDLWNEHPEIRDQNIDVYIGGLNNFIISCLALHKFGEVRERMEELDRLPLQSPGIKARIFENASLWKQSLGMMSGDAEYLEQLCVELEEGLETYTDKIHEVRVMLINYGLAMIYFLIMRHDKALAKVNAILDMKKIELRKDIQANARILNLLIHYELGNEDLLEYITRSTRRYLESRENFYEYEKIIFGALNKLTRKDDPQSRAEIFHELKADLEDHGRNNEEERILINFFDIRAWVDAKVENIPLLEAFRRSKQYST